MNEVAKKPWADARTWKRLLFMFLFAVISRIAEIVLVSIAVIQAIFTLTTGKRNKRLLTFGGELSTYVYQIFQYITYNIEIKPYPFSDWPKFTVSAEARGGAPESGEPWE